LFIICRPFGLSSKTLLTATHGGGNPFAKTFQMSPQRSIKSHCPEERSAEQDTNPADHSILPEPHQEGKDAQAGESREDKAYCGNQRLLGQLQRPNPKANDQSVNCVINAYAVFDYINMINPEVQGWGK
jgi:hypothetical protein